MTTTPDQSPLKPFIITRLLDAPRGMWCLRGCFTGLDGHSNFERNGGASSPLFHSPLAHFYDICAATNSYQTNIGVIAEH